MSEPYDYRAQQDFRLCNLCRTRRPVKRLKQEGTETTSPLVCIEADAEWCKKTREGK